MAVVALPDAPLAAIVPTVELPPAIPFTLQETLVAGLPDPEMVAVKTCAPPGGTLAVAGASETLRPLVSVTVAEPLACGSA